MTIGERLRRARQAQNLSLQAVADKVDLSSATLSRIETSKQSLDLNLFLELADVLDQSPADLLGDDRNGRDGTLSKRYVTSTSRDRLRLWHELIASSRTKRINSRYTRPQIRAMASEIEELSALIEFMHEEIEYLRKRLRNC